MATGLPFTRSAPTLGIAAVAGCALALTPIACGAVTVSEIAEEPGGITATQTNGRSVIRRPDPSR